MMGTAPPTRLPGRWGKMMLYVLLLGAVFVLVCKTVPVRLEEEQVQALAGSLASKVIIVDGPYGGYGPEGEWQVPVKLARWLGQAGAMVLLSGDANPSLDWPPTTSGGLGGVLASAGPADLVVSVRPGETWEVAYPAADTTGEKQLAQAIRQEIALVGTTVPELAAVARLPGYPPKGRVGTPWVQVETGPLDARGQDDLAWAVYAGVVRYFAARPPAVNEKVLDTLENDVPSTLDSR